MAADTERSLRVGSIYIISRFGLQSSRGLYRACSFDLTIKVTRSTGFQQCTLPAAGFPADSFEVMVYSQLHTRSGNHAILTDVIGRLHSIGGISHQVTEFGPTPKQTLVLENHSGETVAVTLWNELTAVLDRVALIQADLIEPVIIAVGSLMVSLVNGSYVCSSSSATRLAVNPQIPEAIHLATHFGVARNPVADLPVEFATAEAAAADAVARTRTIADLLDLYHSGASVEPKYCCGGIVTSVESRSPWYYTACNMCLRKCSTWRGTGYWCPEHWEISDEQIRVGYKIQLTLRDLTGEAPFIIFGSCGNVMTHTTAPLLAQRYPHAPGQLPPELSALVGQYFKFEVKLPMVQSIRSSGGEFRVMRVFPNDNVEVQLPPPIVPPMPPAIVVTPARSSHNSQDVQSSEQVPPNVSPGNLQLSAQRPSEASSSSAKGKAKISNPVYQNLNPVFHIGQPISEMPGQVVNLGLAANEVIPPVSAANNLDISHGGAAPVAHPSSLPGDRVVTDTRPKDLQESPVTAKPVIGDAAASVIGDAAASGTKVVASVADPKSPFTVVMNENPNMATPYKETAFNHPSIPGGSGLVAHSSSPTTKLLASPLAKVKLEKLDDATPMNDSGGLEGSAPFTIGSSTTGVRASKRTPVKRRLYDA